MRSAGDRTRYQRQFAGAATAIVFLSASIATSHANEPWLGSYRQSGSLAPTGAAAMLQLRIPFGSDTSRHSRPTLLLSAGTTWRSEFGSRDFAGFQYAPGIEAGLAFGGDPVLRLGSVDILRFGARWRANANSGGIPNWVWWVGGGVAVVAVLVALDRQCRSNPRTCNGSQPE